MSAAATTVRERFSSEADNWDRLYAPGEPVTIYEHNLRERMKTAVAFVGAPEGRILDVGCGPGNVTIELPDAGGLTATDFALPMLRTARRSARARRKLLDLATADGTALPFTSGSMAAVTTLGLLEYIADPTEVLAEIHRVTRPGGTLVLSAPNARSPFVVVDDALKGLKNLVTRRLLPEAWRREIKRRLGRSDAGYFTHKRHRFNPNALRRALEDLGFAVTEHRYHTFGFGVLSRSRINLSLCRKLESWTTTHTRLESLGWTIVIKAKKLS